MKKSLSKINILASKTCVTIKSIRDKAKKRFFDTSGESQIDTAIKIIIGVVVGALVLGGLILLWENVIMPRLNTEINTMFNS